MVKARFNEQNWLVRAKVSCGIRVGAEVSLRAPICSVSHAETMDYRGNDCNFDRTLHV